MTIDQRRLAFAAAFEERREATNFLQRLFRVRPGNQFRTKSIHIDIMRSGAEVAQALAPGSPTQMPGPRLNTASDYTNGEFTPASYNVGQKVNLNQALARQFGQNPFETPEYRRDLIGRVMRTSALLANKVVRAAERQSAQVLQTGILDLYNGAGQTTYTANFGAKATHFPTVGTPWSDPSAPIRNDLLGLARVIRNDSGIDSNALIMGEDAYEWFIANDTIKDQINFRRADLIRLDARFENSGVTTQGSLNLGNYRFDIMTYNGYYQDEASGDYTDYIEGDKVVMLNPERTRLDKMTSMPDLAIVTRPEVSEFLPGRLGGDLDVTPHAWISEDGKSLTTELATRMVMVPTQIDGFGCMDVDP